MSDYIENYAVIREDSIVALEIRVKELCKKGWTPVGGVSYTGQPDWNYLQAMMRAR